MTLLTHSVTGIARVYVPLRSQMLCHVIYDVISWEQRLCVFSLWLCCIRLDTEREREGSVVCSGQAALLPVKYNGTGFNPKDVRSPPLGIP